MRKAHWLRGNKGEARPQQIIVVDVAGELVPTDENPKVMREYFQGGIAIRWKDKAECRMIPQEAVFRREDDFWEITKNHTPYKTLTWIVGQNLSRSVTLLGLWHKLESGELILHQDRSGAINKKTGKPMRDWRGQVVIRDPPFILVCRWPHGGGTLKFVDLSNYTGWGVSIGNAAGCGRDAGRHGRPYSRPRDMVMARKRCRGSAEWFKGFIGFVSENKLGNVAATAASQSWNAWRHRFMTGKVLCHNNEEVLKLERECYYGGRNECFYVGTIGGQSPDGPSGFMQCNFQGLNADKERSVATNQDSGGCSSRHTPSMAGQVWCYDFNGLYPSVARGLVCPSRLVHSTFDGVYDSSGARGRESGNVGNGLPKQASVSLADLLRQFWVAARVKINSPGRTYPRRNGGQVYWRCGRFSTSLSGQELAAASSAGHIEEVYAAAWYERADLFTEFVDEMYRLRIEARRKKDKLGESVIKLLTNSLFGKFAQKSVQWRPSDEQPAIHAFRHWVHVNAASKKTETYRSIGWAVEKEQEQGEHRDSCPAIAAAITSAGRQRLYEAMTTAGRHNVYYVDTDSLFTNEIGSLNLINAGFVNADELGKLKIVGIYDDAEFMGRKTYRISNRWVLSGFGGTLTDTENISGEYWARTRMEALLETGPQAQCRLASVGYHAGHSGIGGRLRDSGWVQSVRVDE